MFLSRWLRSFEDDRDSGCETSKIKFRIKAVKANVIKIRTEDTIQVIIKNVTLFEKLQLESERQMEHGGSLEPI